MPPVLDPANSQVDGLAFLGLSLSRNHYPKDSEETTDKENTDHRSHADSVTHQTSFNFNELIDRDYQYIFSTNDDGWLIGGGEHGPPHTYKLASKDSSHVEIMRIGTYEPKWGGISQQDIIDAITSGNIRIPQIEVMPTAVVANPDTPPELEIRFDMIHYEAFFNSPPSNDNDNHPQFPELPMNWSLRFLHNQLFKYFQFPSRFCPGAFHSTIVRKAEFRSPQHRNDYFHHCNQIVIPKWQKELGPQPLHALDSLAPTNGTATATEEKDEKKMEDEPAQQEHTTTTPYKSGIYLFTDRENITHFFQPNFLPPYDTVAKRQIIYEFLKEEWDEKTLSWKPFPPPKTQDETVETNQQQEPNTPPSSDAASTSDAAASTISDTAAAEAAGTLSCGVVSDNSSNCVLQ